MRLPLQNAWLRVRSHPLGKAPVGVGCRPGQEVKMSDYVLDLWYMAAWEEEVEGEALLARTLLDAPWLIFRKQDGAYAMLSDRCPHRFAPLHKGEREGDTIHCPYHGLVFEPGGACVRNPFSELIPPNARVRSLPIVARHGALWFWPGDPAAADPELVPDFSLLDGAAEPFVRGRTRFEANYELITDNLMDLSHAEYLHRETFRTEGKIFSGEYKVREDEDGAIWSLWDMRNTARPAWLDALPEGTRLDEWLEMRWHAPASMLLHIGFALAGQAREASPVPPMINPHILTPETRHSTHYFYTRAPGEESAALAHRVFELEDRPMIEEIDAYVGDRDFWEMKPVILHVDAGGIRARRRLMQLRRGEDGKSSPERGGGPRATARGGGAAPDSVPAPPPPSPLRSAGGPPPRSGEDL